VKRAPCTPGRTCHKALLHRPRSQICAPTAWIAAYRPWRNRWAAGYTRYADDLAFSGEEAFDRCVQRFLRARRRHFARGRFHRKSPQDAHHAPGRAATPRGPRGQSTRECHSRRFRKAQGDTDQLYPPRPGDPESRRASSFRSHLDGRVGFVESINRLKASASATCSIRSTGHSIPRNRNPHPYTYRPEFEQSCLVRVAAYQAPLLAANSMEALDLIRRRVEWCEAEGVFRSSAALRPFWGGLADYSEHPNQFAIAATG